MIGVLVVADMVDVAKPVPFRRPYQVADNIGEQPAQFRLLLEVDVHFGLRRPAALENGSSSLPLPLAAGRGGRLGVPSRRCGRLSRRSDALVSLEARSS